MNQEKLLFGLLLNLHMEQETVSWERGIRERRFLANSYLAHYGPLGRIRQAAP